MQYSRLTRRFINSQMRQDVELNETVSNGIFRLAELEDMIEQNVLIKLPCKVGDTVYHIDRYWQSPTIEEYEVYGFTMNDKNELRILVAYGMFCMSKDEIFLTKAEAEAKLEELKGGVKQ